MSQSLNPRRGARARRMRRIGTTSTFTAPVAGLYAVLLVAAGGGGGGGVAVTGTNGNQPGGGGGGGGSVALIHVWLEAGQVVPCVIGAGGLGGVGGRCTPVASNVVNNVGTPGNAGGATSFGSAMVQGGGGGGRANGAGSTGTAGAHGADDTRLMSPEVRSYLYNIINGGIGGQGNPGASGGVGAGAVATGQAQYADVRAAFPNLQAFLAGGGAGGGGIVNTSPVFGAAGGGAGSGGTSGQNALSQGSRAALGGLAQPPQLRSSLDASTLSTQGGAVDSRGDVGNTPGVLKAGNGGDGTGAPSTAGLSGAGGGGGGGGSTIHQNGAASTDPTTAYAIAGDGGRGGDGAIFIAWDEVA